MNKYIKLYCKGLFIYAVIQNYKLMNNEQIKKYVVIQLYCLNKYKFYLFSLTLWMGLPK